MSEVEHSARSFHGQAAGNRRSDVVSDVVEHAPDAIFVFEAALAEPERWHVVYANAAFEALYGVARSQAVNQELLGFLPQRAPPEDVARIVAGLQNGEPFRILHRRTDVSGAEMWLEVNYRCRSESRRVLWFAVSRDVTETVLTQRRSRHLARALDEAQEAMAVSVARDGRFFLEYVNRAFTDILGYDSAELVGKSWRVLLARESDPKQLADYRVGLLTGQKIRGDVLLRRKDGAIVLGSFASTPFESDGTVWAVTTLRDVTDARREERRLREQASLDPLTGLSNRREFERLLQGAIAMTPQGERAHVVMFIDLDGFKNINDTQGHDAGDRVLIAVGQTLRHSLLPSDDVARWGGDEFAAILYFCAPEQAKARGEQLLTALANNAECRGVGASIGVVRVASGTPIAQLMHRADRLVYGAKAAGRNRVMAEP